MSPRKAPTKAALRAQLAEAMAEPIKKARAQVAAIKRRRRPVSLTLSADDMACLVHLANVRAVTRSRLVSSLIQDAWNVRQVTFDFTGDASKVVKGGAL